MRARRRTHHSHVAWFRSDEEFQSQTPRPAWDAAWDRVRAERKQTGLPNTYRNFAACQPAPLAYDGLAFEDAAFRELPSPTPGSPYDGSGTAWRILSMI